MTARIDQFHEQITTALESNDARTIATIVSHFYERHCWYKPWSVTDVHVSTIDVRFSLAIYDGNGESHEATLILPISGGRNYPVLQGCGYEEKSWDTIVDMLCVPVSFLEGMVSLAAMCSCSDFGARPCLLRKIFELQQEAQRLEGHIAELVATHRVFLDSQHFPISARIPDEPAVVHGMSRVSCIDDIRTTCHGVSGVYFAWRVPDGTCVYVGMSRNIASRVSKTRPELSDCQISYIEMPEADAHLWELYWIWRMRPERNGPVAKFNELSREHLPA